jgi:hypothetical protein
MSSYSLAILILVLIAVALACLIIGLVIYVSRTSKQQPVSSNLQLTPKGKSATQAISGATAFIIAIARAKQQGIPPYKIIDAMKRDWEATPTQVCYALMSLGSEPNSLNHPKIIDFGELVALVNMLNNGEKPELPEDRQKNSRVDSAATVSPKTEHGMQAVRVDHPGQTSADPNEWFGTLRTPPNSEDNGDSNTVH